MAANLILAATKPFNVGEAIFLTSTDSVISYNNNGNDGCVNFTLQTYLDACSALWTVPAGVTEICAVAIGGGGMGECSNGVDAGSGGGGGGLAYINNYPVTPGEQFLIVVAPRVDRIATTGYGSRGFPSYIQKVSTGQRVILAQGGGGGNGLNAPGLGGSGAGTYNTVVFSGGDGASGGPNVGGDGGAAANYTSDVEATSWTNSTGGLGQSPYGQYATGTYWPRVSYVNGTNAGGRGGEYGGGGGGADDESNAISFTGGEGAAGCVRIIWGEGRAFPAKKCGEEYSGGNVTAVVAMGP